MNVGFNCWQINTSFRDIYLKHSQWTTTCKSVTLNKMIEADVLAIGYQQAYVAEGKCGT
jgi:hypothetical protein